MLASMIMMLIMRMMRMMMMMMDEVPVITTASMMMSVCPCNFFPRELFIVLCAVISTQKRS